jgi:tetratricopeptide (TPR) repeat protein
VVSRSFPLGYTDANFVRYLFERGFAEECKAFNKLGQSICEQSENSLTEEVQCDLRESHNNQSAAAAETNDPSACLIHAQIWLDLSLKRKLPDGSLISDYELGIVYNETGVAYAMNNMWEDAEKSFIRSIEIFHGLSNYDDTMLGWPEPNLGLIYWVQGRWDEAERVLTEILEIHATTYGPDDTKSFK